VRSGRTEFTPVPQARHYREVGLPVVAVVKEFAARLRTGEHSHSRAQLLFAVKGVMVATTEVGTWLVPPGYALWLPANVVHDVAMHGHVAMRTAYVDMSGTPDLPSECKVFVVSPLLEAALVALSAEPVSYDEHGRGGHLAALVLDEIRRAPGAAFALPVPRDPRLAKLAKALIEDPGLSLNIDSWADAIAVSRRTMTRLFREQTGLSFGAWRRRLRLLRAAARQADGAPISRVAASLGYRSVAAFQAMARREFGAGLRLPPPTRGERRPKPHVGR
jgi:AraC-like DNA-binding protein/quercetin dioxygenase-like cupin family protein